MRAFLRRHAWPLGILAGALALRLILFTGTQGNDDLIYSEAAWGCLQGSSPIRTELLATRVGFTVPLAGLYALLGAHPWVLPLPALVASLGLIFVAWRFGVELHSPLGGAAAALFAAIMPLDVLYATTGFLDVPLAALLGAGAYLAWSASRRETGWGPTIAAGLLWGWAYLVKESALVLIVPILPFVVRPPRWRAGAVLLGVVAAVVFLEALVYGIALGDPLHRFHLARLAQSSQETMSEGFLNRLGWIPSFLVNPAGSWAAYAGAVPAMSLAGLALGWRRDPGASGRLALWWLGSGLLLALFPLSLWPYRPALSLQPRMLTVMTLPGAVLAAGLVESGLRARRWAIGGAVLTGMLALVSAAKLHADSRVWSRGAEWVYEELSVRPGSKVVTDPRTLAVLRWRAGYRPSWDLVAYAPDLPVPVAGTLLVRNGPLAGHAARWDGVSPPPWWDAGEPPRTGVAERRWPAPWRIRGPRGSEEVTSVLRVTPPGTRP